MGSLVPGCALSRQPCCEPPWLTCRRTCVLVTAPASTRYLTESNFREGKFIFAYSSIGSPSWREGGMSMSWLVTFASSFRKWSVDRKWDWAIRHQGQSHSLPPGRCHFLEDSSPFRMVEVLVPVLKHLSLWKAFCTPTTECLTPFSASARCDCGMTH